MRTLKWAFALLLLTGFFLALSLNLYAPAAKAHAEFATWANRSIRVCEPAGYNTNGTCCCKACEFTRKFNDMGNLGIGNGNVSLIKPEFTNDAMKAFNDSLAAANAPAEAGAGNTSAASQPDIAGQESLTAKDVATGTCPACEEAAAEAELTDSLTPNYLLAGGVVTEGTPYGITLGQPMPHILNENPTEPNVLYAKMYGLTMPSGQRIDMGFKTIGYEY